MVVVQATHTFGVNGCDALLHSAQKRNFLDFSAPITSFVIGINLVTKLAIQGKSNGVLYVRFHEIWKEISMRA